MKLIDWARESINENPWAWILGVLLLGSVYWHYREDSDLQTVCTDISDMTAEAPFHWDAFADWQKREMTEIETLCGRNQPDPDSD